MKIAMVINGTRGDVQPMVALANHLIRNGHEITVCCPPGNEQLVTSHNCRFIAFGPDYREIFKQKADKLKSGATLSPSPKEIKEETSKQMDLLPALIHDADIVLGVGFVLGVHTVADILKVPYRFVVFYPAIMGPANSDPLIYRLLFGFGKSMTNMVIKGLINKKRTSAGLNPIQDVWKHWMGEQVIVACDPEINPVKPGIGFNYVQTGYMFLPSAPELPAYVKEFLAKGDATVYIGFGSNPVARPEKYNEMFVELANRTNQRLIVSGGWADLSVEENENILCASELPFEILFPYMKAAVYHGGTGTMAALVRAGIPQAAFPFMADQFENRKLIIKMGLGPATCDFKKMNAESLADAVMACISDIKFRNNAEILAKKLNKADGTESTAQIIGQLKVSVPTAVM